MRFETDRQMSAAWIIVPVLPYVMWLLFFVVILAAVFSSIPASGTTSPTSTTPTFATGFFGILALVYLVFPIIGIFWAYLLYRLVKRRNMHFQRQLFLYDDLIALAKDMGTKKGIDIALPLNNLDRTSREAKFEETEKSAALWAILSFIFGIISFYVFYFLNKDFYRHERRQDIFTDDLAKLLAMVGISLNLPRTSYPVPDRSFILYLVLTIVTGGLFAIYWVYTLLTDPNNHFQYQALIEDTVLAQTGIGSPTPTSTPSTYPQM